MNNKSVVDEFEEIEKLSLTELHFRAYASLDREDNFNLGETEEPHDYDVGEFINEPYDYGSSEYFEKMELLKQKRDQYRKSKEVQQQIIKNKMQKQY